MNYTKWLIEEFKIVLLNAADFVKHQAAHQ